MIIEHELLRTAVFAPKDWVRRRMRAGTPLPVVFILGDGGNAFAGDGTALQVSRATELYPGSVARRRVRHVLGAPVDPDTTDVPYADLFVAVFLAPPIFRRVPGYFDTSGAVAPVDVLDGTWADHASTSSLAPRPDDMGYILATREQVHATFNARYYDVTEDHVEVLDPNGGLLVGVGSGATMAFRLWREHDAAVAARPFFRRLVLVNATLGGFRRGMDLPATPWGWEPPSSTGPVPDLLMITAQDDAWLPSLAGHMYAADTFESPTLSSHPYAIVQSDLQVYTIEQLKGVEAAPSSRAARAARQVMQGAGPEWRRFVGAS